MQTCDLEPAVWVGSPSRYCAVVRSGEGWRVADHDNLQPACVARAVLAMLEHGAYEGVVFILDRDADASLRLVCGLALYPGSHDIQVMYGNPQKFVRVCGWCLLVSLNKLCLTNRVPLAEVLNKGVACLAR